MVKKIFFILVFMIFSFESSASSVIAELVINNHMFEPSILKVPAGQKIKLHVVNKDRTVEEFESFDLKREKIVPGNGSINVSIGPLKPGKYEFFGEFHAETAKGTIIAE